MSKKKNDYSKEREWKDLKKWMKRQNEILENWFIRNYGKRCKEYEKGCIVCKQWKLFDKLKYLKEDFA